MVGSETQVAAAVSKWHDFRRRVWEIPVCNTTHVSSVTSKDWGVWGGWRRDDSIGTLRLPVSKSRSSLTRGLGDRGRKSKEEESKEETRAVEEEESRCNLGRDIDVTLIRSPSVLSPITMATTDCHQTRPSPHHKQRSAASGSLRGVCRRRGVPPCRSRSCRRAALGRRSTRNRLGATRR